MLFAETIELDAHTDQELRVLSQLKRIEVRLQQRARIASLAAKGLHKMEILALVRPASAAGQPAMNSRLQR